MTTEYKKTRKVKVRKLALKNLIESKTVSDKLKKGFKRDLKSVTSIENDRLDVNSKKAANVKDFKRRMNEFLGERKASKMFKKMKLEKKK